MFHRCTFALYLITAWCLMALGLPGVAQQPKLHDGKTYNVDGLTIHLSRPQLVHRSKGYLWFPSMHHLGGERLLIVASTYPDQAQDVTPGVATFSKDGGRTWSEPIETAYGEMAVHRLDGSSLLLSYYLRLQSSNCAVGQAYCIPADKEELRAVDGQVVVSGWPRPIGLLDADLGNPKSQWQLASFVFNGQSVLTKDGQTNLATLYGRFAGAKRYSLVLAESADGLKWNVLSVVADETCKLAGREGPCESALVRLKDGRLLCVFRLHSGATYGYSISYDDGRTWSEPANLSGTHSVQPSLSVAPEGMVLLSGGRPGLFLWLNRQGDAVRWDVLDLARHHNHWVKDEPILKATVSFDSNTSSYTEVRWLDNQRFVVVYDRLANGWNPIPPESEVTNSIWVVHGRIR